MSTRRPRPPRTVGEPMHTDVVAIGVDAGRSELADLMRGYGISGLPVADDRGMAVGAASITTCSG